MKAPLSTLLCNFEENETLFTSTMACIIRASGTIKGSFYMQEVTGLLISWLEP